MKIEQLLVQHFYNTREITLQGLGTFRLSPDFVLPSDNEKEVVMPENAINFEYNPKAGEDDALIDYIVQQTRKIKPLASADLDSYLVLGKQFLNIGKPFRIEGLGVLEKNMEGAYVFHQGHYSSAKVEVPPAILKEKSEDDISFAAERNASRGGRKKGLMIAAGILVLGLLGWGTWYYFNRNQSKAVEQVAENNSPAITDTIVKTDSARKTDTTVVSNPVNSNNASFNIANPDGYTFRIVFRESGDEEMMKTKMKELIARKHNVVLLSTPDSLLFRLAEPYKNPLSDTARVRDSLNKYYYGGKGYVELYH